MIILRQINIRTLPQKDIEDSPGISVILLGVVGLVKDEKIDFVHRYEGVHETLVQYFGSTNNDHIFGEDIFPFFLCPEIAAHFSAEAIHLLVQVAFKDSGLLEHQRDTVHL